MENRQNLHVEKFIDIHNYPGTVEEEEGDHNAEGLELVVLRDLILDTSIESEID